MRNRDSKPPFPAPDLKSEKSQTISMQKEKALDKAALWKADLILLFCALVWGGTFVGVKLCLEQITPFLLVFFRFSLSALLFLLLFYKEIRGSSLKDLYAGFLLAFFLLGGFAFQTVGLMYTSIARSAFLTEALVIFLPFLQVFILKRRLLRSTLLGVFVVLLGILLLSIPQIELENNPLNKGDGWTLLCALSFSFFIVFIDRFQFLNPKRLMFFQSLGASLGALFIVFSNGEWKGFIPLFENNFASNQAFPFSLLFWILYLGLLASGLAIFLQLRYQPLSSPARAGVIFGSEPVIASILGFLLLGEIMKGNEIAGALLVILGVLAMELIPFLRQKRS